MTTKDNQAQRAGSDSTQLQAGRDIVVNQGVSAAEAAIIAAHSGREAAEFYTREGLSIAHQRIDEFDQKLVDKFSEQNLLEIFAEPSFQRTLRKAQISAASSERDDDIDLIVGLLEARVRNGDSRPIRASISRAVEVVEEVDDVALRALTIAQIVLTVTPVSGDMREGLGVLDRIYGQMLSHEAPEGRAWLEHLEVLGAVRISSIGTGRELADFWSVSALAGYMARGTEVAATPDPNRAEILPDVPGVALRPHELKPGFLRLDFPNVSVLRGALSNTDMPSGQIDAYLAAAKADWGLGESDAELVGPFDTELSKFESLATLRAWWNQIPVGFSITGVGRVLAVSNAKLLDTRGLLPELDFD